jgi:excisionase family DNA binding protein
MKEYISLKDAAEIIGVHPSTVRLWTDKGVIPSHRTVGGHRRFRREDVELWAEHAHNVGMGSEAMMQSAMRNVRVRIAEGSLEAESWYQKLDEDARLQYRQSAQWLFQGLMAFLASDDKDIGTNAHAIGYEYASRGHRYKLGYVESVHAFLFFRNTLIEAVAHVHRKANIPFDEMLHRIHHFTDMILISLLESYEEMELVR